MRSVYGSSTVGDREHQEDDFSFVLANDHRSNSDVLMILCDGMGGHVGGEVASTTAVQAFQASFESDKSTDPQKRLAHALDAANKAIGEKIRVNSQFEGMGSTLVGAIKLSNRLVWISVGDSHIYLFRSGNVAKLNADHSLFSELLEKVRKGEITMEEARSNPKKNALMSAVMGRNIALVDLNQVSLKDGDMIVLASDGLDTLPDEKLKSILEAKYGAPPQEVTEALLEAVRGAKKPRQDNTSVVVCYHTTKTFPFWKEATHWANIEKQLSRGKLSKPLVLGFVAVTVSAIALAAFMFSSNGTQEVPVVNPLPAPPAATKDAGDDNSVIGSIKAESLEEAEEKAQDSAVEPAAPSKPPESTGTEGDLAVPPPAEATRPLPRPEAPAAPHEGKTDKEAPAVIPDKNFNPSFGQGG